MRYLFISDLHLGDHEPQLTQLFLAFMEQFVKSDDQLYILGDLFEAWIGDDVTDPTSEQVIKALSDFTKTGGNAFVMHGNRDFLLGDEFSLRTGSKLLEEPFPINLAGKQCLLLHGDALCTDDTEYQKFKTMVREPSWQQAFLSKSAEQRLAIARGMRDQSKASMSTKSQAIMDVSPEAVRELFHSTGAEIMIHGHTHRQNTHQVKMPEGVRERMVLGDWGETGCVLIAEHNQLEMLNFRLADLSA